jgi:uroporphyrinogen decarboxylase
MRQAGRYMDEYRAVRANHSMWELIKSAELSARVTLQPIQRFTLDAAIIFADILPPLKAMGLELDYVKGDGPVFQKPISRTYEIELLATPPANETMSGTLEAIRLVVAELAPRNLPVIGFAGAPFTLACYAIEGGASKNFSKTKTLMYHEPAAWTRLMTKLVTVQTDYLKEQVRAGAAAVQIFDSWAGQALGMQDYVRYVQPFNRKLFQALAEIDVPVINFSTGTAGYLEEVAACGGNVISVDWRIPLDRAWERIGFARPIQGNLDPAALLAPWSELKLRVDEVLKQAAGRLGHIFNLGHGILPDTPVENVKRLVDYVHEQTTG